MSPLLPAALTVVPLFPTQKPLLLPVVLVMAMQGPPVFAQLQVLAMRGSLVRVRAPYWTIAVPVQTTQWR